MFNIRLTLLTAFSFACLPTVYAEKMAIRPDSLLTEVQVKASKYPAKLSQTGKVVSIISQEQIQKSLGKNLGELLQERVGISIVGARSAPGSNQEVYVRGSNTGNVLLLIDGFPANDPSHISSVLDWNLIDLGSLERIEIMKGGQSTLYGSDAMAGVINLITRKSGSSLSLQAGGLGTHAEAFQTQKTIKSLKFGLALKNFQTQGFSAAANQSEKDGMGQQNIRVNLGSAIGKHADWDLYYQSEFYQASLDGGPFTDERDYTAKASNHAFRAQFHQQFVQGDLFVRLFQDITHRFFRNDSTDIPDNAWSNYSESAYVGLNQGAESYVKWKLPAGIQTVAGVEFRNQSTAQSDYSISAYGRYDSPVLAASLANIQLLGTYVTFEKHQEDVWGLELGGRLSNHSLYGNNLTYHVNPYLYLWPKGKLFANYYSSFKAPSLYQLYSPYGNKDLKAEQGKTFEAGFEQNLGPLYVRLVGFQQDVQDGIVFQSIAVDPYGRYANVSKQNTSGIELEARYTWKGFATELGYTYLDGKMHNQIDGKDTTYSALIRRPKHQLSLRVNQQLTERWSASVYTQYVGERTDYYYDDATYQTQSVILPGYVWTELQSTYALNKRWRVQAILKNVLNQMPTEMYGYSGQPRNLQLSLLGTF
ncbi:TonB-dependent receptor plug domain-containing protein [Aquirufa sp. TARAVU-A1A]